MDLRGLSGAIALSGVSMPVAESDNALAVLVWVSICVTEVVEMIIVDICDTTTLTVEVSLGVDTPCDGSVCPLSSDFVMLGSLLTAGFELGIAMEGLEWWNPVGRSVEAIDTGELEVALLTTTVVCMNSDPVSDFHMRSLTRRGLSSARCTVAGLVDWGGCRGQRKSTAADANCDR